MIERGKDTTVGDEVMMMGGVRTLSVTLLTLLLLTPTLAVSAEAKEESPHFTSPVADDRFSAGWMDSTYNDSEGTEIDLRLYYPAATAGEGVVMDCAWAPYPWVAFHADEGESHDAYNWVGYGLAEAGYVVVVIGEERRSDRIYQAVSDHLSLIERVGHTNLTGGAGPAGSRGCIDMDHWGVAGHGRGAALAIGVYSNWNIIFNLGIQPPRALFGLGLDTDQIGLQMGAADVAMPDHSLFLTGTADNVAPVDDHIKPLLQNWNGGWQLLEVVGANHVQYEDDQSFWDNLLDGDATMTASEQQSHAMGVVKPYLDLTLKGSDEAWYAATSRENNPSQPSDPKSYLSENLEPNQFYRMTLSESLVDAPLGRTGHLMFYDRVAQRTVLSSGYSGTESFADQWTLDLAGSAEWDHFGDGPNSYSDYTFAGDGVASGLALSPNLDGDATMWSWNGYSSSWTAYPEGVRPEGMVGQSLVWDNGSHRYIMYGGSNLTSGESHNSTWAFNPEAAYWYNLSTPNSPEASEGAVAFFSSGWNRTILFGGRLAQGGYSNQMWMYDAASNRWSHLSLTGEEPSGRIGMASAVDLDGGFAYIFGGIGYMEGTQWVDWQSDLWRLDLNQLTWTSLPSYGIGAMMSAEMVFDAAENQLVLFGGYDTAGLSDKTWLYNLTTEEWTLHDSSSAVTSSDVIHLSAFVTERDLEMPPANLTVKCRVNDGVWIAGSWMADNQSAECDLSPEGISPGFHAANLRVELDGKRATSTTTFERANAPPVPHGEMPTFILMEEGQVSINASEIASDVDQHRLTFKRNAFTAANYQPSGSEPQLDYLLKEGRQVLEITDLSDWTGRSEEETYQVCVYIVDEATPGSPPAEVPICFDLFHQPIDDPYILVSPASYSFDEDAETVEMDLAVHVSDQEGDEPAVWLEAPESQLAGAEISLSAGEEGTAIILATPAPHWNGEANATLCILRAIIPNGSRHATDCFWLNVSFTVSPVADAPIFNITDIFLEEDSVKDIPLTQLVWDPDGDDLNLTIEAGESHLMVEIWHEQLRITPDGDWFGRAVNWAILADDGEQTTRQILRIAVDGVDDESIVEWTEPADISDNLTQLRFDIRDVDSDGPWLVEYSWDDGDWQQISPSCALLKEHEYECQADLLAHQLDWGDHKISLRVNDGNVNSDVESFWLSKPDPNYAGLDDSNQATGFAAIALVATGLLLLGGAAAVVYFSLRKGD